MGLGPACLHLFLRALPHARRLPFRQARGHAHTPRLHSRDRACKDLVHRTRAQEVAQVVRPSLGMSRSNSDLGRRRHPAGLGCSAHRSDTRSRT